MLLQEKRLVRLFCCGHEMTISHDEPRACIPPKERIVVTGRTNGFSFFVPSHGLPQPFVCTRAVPRVAMLELRLCPPLIDKACEVRPVVLVTELLRALPRVLDGRRHLVELLRKREQQCDQGLLVAGVG